MGRLLRLFVLPSRRSTITVVNDGDNWELLVRTESGRKRRCFISNALGQALIADHRDEVIEFLDDAVHTPDDT